MLTRKLTAMGLWPQAFMDLANVTAAGTTIADAAQTHTSDIVVNAGTGGILLPKGGEPADEVCVINTTGASINVYPSGKDTLNGAQTAVALAATKYMKFKCVAEGAWLQLIP